MSKVFTDFSEEVRQLNHNVIQGNDLYILNCDDKYIKNCCKVYSDVFNRLSVQPFLYNVYISTLNDEAKRKIFDQIDDINMTRLVNSTAGAFQYASESVRSTKSIAEFVTDHYSWLFEYVGDNLKKDKHFVLSRLEKCGKLLEYVDPCLLSDDDVLRTAIRKRPSLIHNFGTEAIRDDKDFVLELLEKNGTILRSLSMRLRADKEVVLNSLDNAKEFKHAAEQLRDDEKFIWEAINDYDINYQIIKYMSDRLKNDFNFMAKLVFHYSPAIQFASETLKKNHQLALFAMHDNGSMLQYTDKTIKDNLPLVLIAIRSQPNAYFFASERIQALPEVKILAGIKDKLQRKNYYEKLLFKGLPEPVEHPAPTNEKNDRRNHFFPSLSKRETYNGYEEIQSPIQSKKHCPGFS